MGITAQIVLAFIAINSLVSVAFSVVCLVKNHSGALRCLLVSLFVPAVGPVMCVVMFFPSRGGRCSIAMEESIHRLKMTQMEYVDAGRLMDAVPANDALSLSSESERRGYLLGLLRRRDISSLRGILHKAVCNEDSEASHYAASAIMELQRASYLNMDAAAGSYVPGRRGSYKAAVDYALSIMLYLENSEIGQLENHTFRNKYEQVMRDIIENHPNDRTGGDYAGMTGFLLKQGRNEEAMAYATAYSADNPRDENGYLLVMRCAHLMGDAEGFYKALGLLRSSETVLSPDGLSAVRFWMQNGPREGEVVGA